ncbi:hypothetical protein OXV70_04195 [Bacteroides ovatus]|nr:hypothetical protein [Bacteroides ovatus]
MTLRYGGSLDGEKSRPEGRAGWALWGGCMRCRCGCCEGSHVVRAYNGGCAAGTLREGRVGRCKLQDTGMGFLC